MAITLPKFGTKVPSETTLFANLGRELREFGQSFESVLASFDYNGKDPNLVLSRVAALEALNDTRVPGLLVGTTTQRAMTVAPYGTIWQDTNGDKRRWISNGSAWRRESGTATAPAGAWSSFANGNAGRTVSVSIPTVLELNETIQVSATAVGSGFGLISLSTLTRLASSTTLSLRHMQLNSNAENPITFVWRVVPV